MSRKRISISALCAVFFWLAAGSGLLGGAPELLGGPGKARAATGPPPPESWVGQPTQGDDYAGSETCLDCHEELERPFRLNIHSRTPYWGSPATGCEACHGPGKAHSESDGDLPITNPATLEEAEASSICLSCHKGALAQRYWQGSEHESMNVSCVSCHSIHANYEHLLNNPFEPETCYKCHPEKRRFLFKRSSHPLRDPSRRVTSGKMACSDCHNPHGSQSEHLISANSVNDKCYQCHQEMKAPVLWEHSPVKENCLNCHNPHGSNYEKMLVAKRPRLCQQCHESGRHQTVAGEPTSFVVVNRGCSNCHAQVHGSNHPSGLKLKR